MHLQLTANIGHKVTINHTDGVFMEEEKSAISVGNLLANHVLHKLRYLTERAQPDRTYLNFV